MSENYVSVEIDETINECSCCGKRNLKRTVHLSYWEEGEEVEIHIGVICTGKWFKQTMTGNPFYAAAKLEKHINLLEPEEFFEIIDQIKEAAERW